MNFLLHKWGLLEREAYLSIYGIMLRAVKGDYKIRNRDFILDFISPGIKTTDLHIWFNQEAHTFLGPHYNESRTA